MRRRFKGMLKENVLGRVLGEENVLKETLYVVFFVFKSFFNILTL